jgi:hypothetical protein
MRKIEKAMCAAVKERRNWKSSNTEVKVREDAYGYKHVEVRLFKLPIWKWNEAEDLTEFSMAGWNTNATRSRLNALGVHVTQRNFIPYYNGREISDYAWHVVK